ncbi:transposable element Tc1 transposase [Trichonephila clavipes]|nr:transposable element Tc1 transposase [Trichonephila clavipes]
MTVPVVQSVNGQCNAPFNAWEREHRDWSVEDWKRVAWSNESQFQLLNNWWETENMASELLDDHLHLFMLICYPHSNGVFQQDNGTPHKSWLTTGWLDEPSSQFSVINWPSRSPDLNPIRHLWDVLEQGVKGTLWPQPNEPY